MLRYAFSFLLTFGLLFSVHAQPAAEDVDREHLAQRFLVLSGMNGGLEASAQEMGMSLMNLAQMLQVPNLQGLQEDLQEVLDTDLMRQDARAYLTEHLEPDTARLLFDWLNGSVGQRIVGYQLALNHVTNEEAEAFFTEHLAEGREPTSHEALVEEVADLSGEADYLAEVVPGQLDLVFEVLNARAGAEEQFSEDELVQIKQVIVTQFTEQLQEMTVLGAQFIYRDASQEELEAYAEFLRSPLGARYQELTIGASLAMHRAAMDRLRNETLAVGE